MTNALFYAFAAMTIASALVVVISRNIVRTSVGLLFTLLSVGGLYFLLNAEFLAAVQLVVYVGGTLILIVFGVMLTGKAPFTRFEPKTSEVIIAITAGSLLFTALWLAIEAAMPAFSVSQPEPGRYPLDLLGQALLGDFLVPFELASVLLLVVMIGAAYLAKARKREPESQAIARELSNRAKQWT
jgi:NADH-quinone oxidoreductase subunit J